MNSESRRLLQETRFNRPGTFAELARQRQRRSSTSGSGQLLIVAADHPAKGAFRVGSNPDAMGNRYELLDRLVVALSSPFVDGVLATPDVVEDLLLLGVLENKLVFGSMNRGGLPGASFEMDDRFTAYTPESIIQFGLDGGKMLLRINLDDPGSVNTLAACAASVTALASAGRIAMLEPFMTKRVNALSQNQLTTEDVVRSCAIASGLGSTSAYSWLKIPIVNNMSQVAESVTLPLLLLGGDQSGQPDEMFQRWEEALQLPGVRGLVVGRNLLYPPDDDVGAAVKTVAGLLLEVI